MKNILFDNIKLAASILSADFSNLGDELVKLDKCGADLIHIDVMDGKFVPNITMGPPIISKIRRFTKKTFDVHLMIDDPLKYIDEFYNAGAEIITIHYEADAHPIKTLDYIKSKGIKAGISINPATDEKVLEYLLDYCDLVLIMLVNPGFGGQKTIKSQYKKVENVRKMIDNNINHIDLEVDGGVNINNSQRLVKAGANILVAGNAIFKDGPECYRDNINALKTSWIKSETKKIS